MNLTTFRKSGVGVTTPVWFAQEGETLYVVTDANSGKTKRLRNNDAVEVGPSDARGKPLGDVLPAHCRILPEAEGQTAWRALLAKYGWQLRLFQFMWLFRRTQHIFLAIQA
jgi:PPOX class probable F420-dependent enzyme